MARFSGYKRKVRSRVGLRRKMRYRRKYNSKRTAKRIARAVVNRIAETKMVTHTISSTLFNSGISVAGDILKVIPTVSQGTASYERTGNKVVPKRVIMTGVVSASPNNEAIVPPLEVTMFVLRCKYKQTFTDVGVNDLNFLQDASSSVQYDGSLARTMLPIDHARFEVVKRKRIKLQAPSSQWAQVNPANTSAVISPAPGVPYAARYRCVFKPKMALKYNEDDPLGTNPNNVAYFCCFGYSYLQGFAADTLTTRLQVLGYRTMMYYTDF